MEKVQIRPKILLAVSVLMALVCGLMILRINVNSDMTKYLPDDSKMKQGMDILSTEFGQSASSAVADVRIMMKDLSEEQKTAVKDSLGHIEGVDGVSVSYSGDYSLYELSVAKSVHQKRLAKQIKSSFPYECVTQTSQDGNTPDPKALVLAIICLFIILLVMSESYLEPLLFLIATGMAVAVNMGTNALLDSVSITTHSIAAVLQLALSMDYSIILMSRFRQQLSIVPDKYEAMSAAMKKATPAILSSSLTTVVGLLMLSFMNLKIGKDLGIVLAKGVICSLLYTYSALPGLILLCSSGIKATQKKYPQPRTDGLAEFSRKYRIPITAVFVILFLLSYQLSTRTPIKFSTSTPTEIDKVFAKKNPVVLLYDNAAEDSVLTLLERVALDPKVTDIYSYPTLMKKKLSAEDMVAFLQQQAASQGREGAEMLTPELMKFCYYSNFGDKDLKIGFTDLVDFVVSQSDNPLLADVGIPDLSEKLEMLDALREMNSSMETEMPAKAPETPVIEPESKKEEIVPPTVISAPAVTETNPSKPADKMTVYEYMKLLNTQQNNADTRQLLTISNPVGLKTKMSVEQMTAFIGSTPAQTRMVYSFSKNSKEGMTPLEFAHFLTDDLFSRKALAKMVSAEQKEGMFARTAIMDAAASEKVYSKEDLDAMVLRFGLKEVLRTEVEKPSAEEKVESEPVIVESPAKAEPDAETTENPDTEPVEEPVRIIEEPVKAVEIQEDHRLVLLNQMMKPGRKYDAGAMARNFRTLGENVDDNTVALLYDFYGSANCYDPEWKMDLNELIGFIGDKIINNESLEAYIGEDIRSQFDSMKDELTEGVGMLKGDKHSIAAIITDYPDESAETEKFIKSLDGDYYLIGESVMLSEMKDGFQKEMRLVTLLTIIAIFTIVAITFRSLLIAALLVMTVMTAVFINVAACGIGGGAVLYLAYLIVQSILMGATIDYGILFTTYYRENYDIKEAYRGSIHTILTSGLIICCVPGAMALLLDDAMIQPIVKCLAVGAFSAIVIILFILPGVLSLICNKKK